MSPSFLLPLFGALLLVRSEVTIINEPERFAPGIASTDHSEIRLTLSPDGHTALWFSRNRPGGPGGYDIWMSRRLGGSWGTPEAVSFNSPTRDFDPAFSADGRYVYFSSDRPGGLGGDDIYRVPVTREGFGAAEHLGPLINSPGKEWAPMLSPDGKALLFSSDRAGGQGKQDLYIARRNKHGFAPAEALPGNVNTTADEFDATFLADNRTVIFSRAPDLMTDKVELFAASPSGGRYPSGTLLARVNGEKDSYGPMLDWSEPDVLTFSAQRPGSGGMDLYRVRYRLSQ